MGKRGARGSGVAVGSLARAAPAGGCGQKGPMPSRNLSRAVAALLTGDTSSGWAGRAKQETQGGLFAGATGASGASGNLHPPSGVQLVRGFSAAFTPPPPLAFQILTEFPFPANTTHHV